MDATNLAELLTAALWLLAVPIALSGMDDLLIDCLSHARTLKRRLTVYRTNARCSCVDLPRTAQRPTALLIPAWREADVIADMLAALRASLDYSAYRVILGTYPNDRATRDAARAVDPKARWLEIVVLPHAGPTSKADCLNAVWRGALALERRMGRPFELFVLHDAEDVVHRDELTIFSYLADRADMVQLPVVPLPGRWHEMVAGHYCDEFAEAHQKDLVLREGLAGGVPSPGVGCALTRSAMLALAGASGEPFSRESLTEDYDLALRLLRMGRRSIFVRLTAQANGGAAAVVATREYFPSRFSAAVRQKARWLIGIGLQGWRRQGWHGSFWHRYMLLRDRKAILAAFLTAAAYGLALTVAAYESAVWAGVLPDRPLVAWDSPLAWLLTGNLVLLLNRLLHRVYYVARLYGLGEGLLAVPRLVMANAINFFAAARAVRLYLRHRLTGRPLRWDKTTHRFDATLIR